MATECRIKERKPGFLHVLRHGLHPSLLFYFFFSFNMFLEGVYVDKESREDITSNNKEIRFIALNAIFGKVLKIFNTVDAVLRKQKCPKTAAFVS